MNRWGIYYRGVLAESFLTHVKANSRAYLLIKDKGWAVEDVSVKQVIPYSQA